MRGKIELRRERIDVATAVARAVETAQPAISEQQHALELELPSEPVWLDADLIRLSQIISNLLNNAAKYTEKGGRIGLTVDATPGHVTIRVRDNGIGIPREMLPRIFGLFMQADRSIERSQGGLGIGLTIVQILVEKHGGTISAHSDGPGRGSEFTVRLPRAGDAPASHTVEPEAAPPFTRMRRVLVVDDNVDGAATLAMLLQTQKHQVRIAHDGPTALGLIAADAPDVVFLDIGMPGMSGYEVAQRIRQMPGGREILIVAVTGYGQEENRRQSAEAGIDLHLVKPIDLDAIRKVLE
jgi:CheY-like chemotaxis protein/two-component sensor histidine kinase